MWTALGWKSSSSVASLDRAQSGQLTREISTRVASLDSLERDEVVVPADLVAERFIDQDLPRAFSALDDMHLLGDLADAASGTAPGATAFVARTFLGGGTRRA